MCGNIERGLPALFTLRQAQGKRLAPCFAGTLLLARCLPFDRLRANGLHSARAPCAARLSARLELALQRACSIAVRPSTGSGQLAFLQGPFLNARPSAVRANGSALQRACSFAVHPSTGSGRTVMCCRQRGSLASPNRTVKLRAMGLLECPVTPMLPYAACRACVAPGPVPRPMAVGSSCVRR